MLAAAILIASACTTADGPIPETGTSTTTTLPRAISTTTEATTTTTPAVPTTTTTQPPYTEVISAGTYTDTELVIHIRIVSEVADVTSQEFSETAMAILTDATGWGRAGFVFEEDDDSNLVLVLAEGSRVDDLCLPLETHGTVSCQNGEVVALNADRWRRAWDGWDASVDAYRHYLVTHEVGHLLGLRHPATNCPAGEAASAAMDPQTRTTLHCPGNGVPLDWEIEWASNRPAVIAPLPDWDGPRPKWPTSDP